LHGKCRRQSCNPPGGPVLRLLSVGQRVPTNGPHSRKNPSLRFARPHLLGDYATRVAGSAGRLISSQHMSEPLLWACKARLCSQGFPLLSSNNCRSLDSIGDRRLQLPAHAAYSGFSGSRAQGIATLVLPDFPLPVDATHMTSTRVHLHGPRIGALRTLPLPTAPRCDSRWAVALTSQTLWIWCWY